MMHEYIYTHAIRPAVGRLLTRTFNAVIMVDAALAAIHRASIDVSRRDRL